MKALRLILFLHCVLFSYVNVAASDFDCADTATLFAAAHAGNRKTLENHLRHQCPIDGKDVRGFTLYDVATLKGDKTLMQWLIKKQGAHDGRYSPSMIRLIQTGLRFLGFDAGLVNGKMTDATREGIRAYQRFLGVKADGKILPNWTAGFYRRLIREMQNELETLGFGSGRADGVLGKKTLIAMKKFRKEYKMPESEYPYIDGQLIYQLMMADNEARKREIEKKRQLQASRAAARRQEKARLNAKRSASPDPQGGQEQGKRQKSTEKARPAQANQRAKKARQAQEQAELKQRLDLLVAEHEAAKEKGGAQEAAIVGEKPKKIAAKAREHTRQATAVVDNETAPHGAATKKKGETVETARQSSSRSVPKAGKGFNRLSGTLLYQDKSTQCSIDGQRIDANWCRTYYRSGNGRHCDAIVSHSGIVFSLLCK